MILTKKGNRVNKFQGAYNRIEYFIYKVEKYGQFDDFDKLLKDFEVAKDLETIYKLTDKTIPKKPDNFTEKYLINIRYCHECFELLPTKNKYCHECGTPLDWSEDE